MNHRAKPNLSRLGRDVLFFNLTDPGKYVLTALAMATLTGSLTLSIPVYHVFVGMVCLWLISFLASVPFRPKVSVEGDFPPRVIAGRAFTGEFRVTNESRRPALDLSLGVYPLPVGMRQVEPVASVPQLARGQTVRLSMKLQARRRGVYSIDGPRPFTTFPFNLRRNGPPPRRGRSVIALPEFHPLLHVDIPAQARHQPGGIALTSNIGESPEYIGNREYRPGDSTRRIDFRAWARLAQPAVKEYQEEYYCRIALVLDTFIDSPWWRPRRLIYPNLEAAVSLSAAVADALSRGEYIIDIFAAGPELYVFRAGRHTTHFENVLEILAGVGPCRRNPFEIVTPALADELSNISSVICVLLDWDAPREQLVRRAAEAGCAPKVLIVRDGPTSLPIAGAELWGYSVTQLTPADVRRGALEVL